MNYKTRYHHKIDIENVINQRLKLQNVQRSLTSLHVQGLTDASQLKSYKFIDFFNEMETDKQKSLLVILGGPANLKKTNDFIKGLKEQFKLVFNPLENINIRCSEYINK